ncbi:GntR family transcriptional regulator [Brenneria tiliae]|uniref:GntR family transcriptional regulator n=1 Tax=Brenneria tiliae TaxID=2914984 RepID=UPI002014AA39|nr:GntR family transcriptional regulator [Brenneria tiliae]MCL2896558.1 GntR family transcriptional regulator [Brenneria tiliae]MCL2901192.1 GntR family transcriptional regulator [Brenneria tiliae]
MSKPFAENESQGRRHAGRYIYDTLRKQILTLRLRPGTQLDEISLAAQFGLSRSPVRDALARLAAESLVTILPNRTTIVTPFEIEEFPNYIAALDLMQRAVTRLAALQRTDEELEHIRAANTLYMQAVASDDFSLMTEKNKIFHLAVAKAGKNHYLSSHYERLLEEGQRLQHLQFEHMARGDAPMKLGRDHDEMIEAIAGKNPDVAERSAHEHTMLFQSRFLYFMQQNLIKDMSII